MTNNSPILAKCGAICKEELKAFVNKAIGMSNELKAENSKLYNEIGLDKLLLAMLTKNNTAALKHINAMLKHPQIAQFYANVIKVGGKYITSKELAQAIKCILDKCDKESKEFIVTVLEIIINGNKLFNHPDVATEMKAYRDNTISHLEKLLSPSAKASTKRRTKK